MESAATLPFHISNMSADYDPLSEESQNYIRSIIEDYKTPGLAVAVVHGDKTYSSGYGYADLDTKEPVTPQTFFFTGSTTKSFTAAVASQLVYANDRTKWGDIKWTTPLSKVMPEDFVLQDEYATKHTNFTDALSHRTGMPRHDMTWINGNPSMGERVRNLRHLPLHNELRTTWEYCNLMFSAVVQAIETITDEPMNDLLHSWIWKPLGMASTNYRLSDAIELSKQKDNGINLARGYLWDEKTKSNKKVEWESMPPASGSGGIISNVLDYTKWIRLFLHPGSSDDNPGVLSTKAVVDMTQAHMPIPKDPDGPFTGQSCYGLGLTTGIYRGHQIIGHEGAIPGYMSSMWWIPDLDWGVVVMHNSYSLEHKPVVWHLIDDFLQTPKDERYKAVGWLKDLKSKDPYLMEDPREELYPGSPSKAEIQPAVALEEYAGFYEHPAFHDFTLSTTRSGDTTPQSERAALQLYGEPSTDSFLDLKITFHHVNGEYWYAHLTCGPSRWLGDQFMKAKFEVDVDGKVRKMGLQIEKALDELIWFDKK